MNKYRRNYIIDATQNTHNIILNTFIIPTHFRKRTNNLALK